MPSDKALRLKLDEEAVLSEAIQGTVGQVGLVGPVGQVGQVGPVGQVGQVHQDLGKVTPAKSYLVRLRLCLPRRS